MSMYCMRLFVGGVYDLKCNIACSAWCLTARSTCIIVVASVIVIISCHPNSTEMTPP
jgi:hypothetical protein